MVTCDRLVYQLQETKVLPTSKVKDSSRETSGRKGPGPTRSACDLAHGGKTLRDVQQKTRVD